MFNRRHRNHRSVQKIIASIAAIAISLALPRTAYAVCPICTIAVGAGLGLSRYLGIDDSITGIWIGGLMVSLTIWTSDWLQKKNWKALRTAPKYVYYLVSSVLYLLLTYPPLFWVGIIGHPFNTILGIDKLVFGSALGAAAFLFGFWADKKVRKLKGRQLFIYQKVAFPVISLVITSLVLYFFGGYLYKL